MISRRSYQGKMKLPLSKMKFVYGALFMCMFLRLISSPPETSSGRLHDQLQLPVKTTAKAPFCEKNPYLKHVLLNHSEIQNYYTNGLIQLEEQVRTNPETNRGHKRFQVFKELGTCTDVSCIGGRCRDDESKIVCGFSTLFEKEGQPPKECLVYSIGGDNKWEFERGILASNATGCHVHTFDCTGEQSRFRVPQHERLHFHYECLKGDDFVPPKKNRRTLENGHLFLTLPEITAKYHHSQIDLLKMDIEIFEWGVFSAMKNLSHAEHEHLPMQMMVEVHYRDQYLEGEYSELELIQLARDLFELGYIVVKRDDNMMCPHCSELTLLRVYC